MDLKWDKQIHVLNKYIMDWRWKALTAKVDPAQLKTSVIEYLIPKLEIGFAHADITSKMCGAWMSTIIYTLCQRGDMSMAHSINRKGFCILAGLPDLWMRMQTARATELLVNMNTKYCLCGRSTRARFCSLLHLPRSKIRKATEMLRDKNSINVRSHCRISSTIQYLNNLNMHLVHKEKGDKGPCVLVADIQRVLENRDDHVAPIIVYTDGSTNPKAACKNSGAAIVITDSSNKTIWSGGLIVRSDGNNFIPELAAATIVIKACLKGTPMLLRMDSTAAIGAISKGPLSERKRVRAAGRPWLNFCRDNFIEKQHHVTIEHVSSHKGTNTTEQKGNDAADVMANEYRRLEEKKPACPYFTEAEEQYVLQHKRVNIQGDARSFLKSLERQQMLEIWMKKAPKQAQWMTQYPTQIMKQSKRVWRWSIEEGKGSAWIYFIFAICQWLPTNHRIHYSDKSGYDLGKCKVCLTNEVEDTNHLFTCPALRAEHVKLQIAMDSKLQFWHVPFANKCPESLEERTCRAGFEN